MVIKLNKEEFNNVLKLIDTISERDSKPMTEGFREVLMQDLKQIIDDNNSNKTK